MAKEYSHLNISAECILQIGPALEKQNEFQISMQNGSSHNEGDKNNGKGHQ